MLKETSEWRSKRLVAGKEARPREDALSTELLDDSALGKDDREDVAKRRKGDENAQRPLGLFTHDISEERGGEDPTRAQDLGSRDGRKVGNVGEHVQDGDDTQGERGGNFECPDGVLGLGKSIVGVRVANVTPDDIVEGGDDTVTRPGRPGKGVGKVVGLLLNLDVSAEGDEAANDDDQQDRNLDDAEQVLQPQPPFERKTVDEKGGGDAGDSDATLVESIDLDSRRRENVLSKYDRVASSPSEEQGVPGVHTSDEQSGFLVHKLEVVLLASVSWQSRAKLHVDEETRSGDEGSDDPHEEGEADRAAQSKDATGCSEDTGSNHPVDDAEG